MTSLNARTVRYARAWVMGPGIVAEDEIVLDRDGVDVPATIVRPADAGGPFPAWVAMHGITRPGRAHAQLVRFTHAVASAGLLTIVPEVPEWRELSLVPHLSGPTVRAAIDGLRKTGLAQDGPVGVIGFSFGAPHAIATAGLPGLRDEIGAAAGFGGYCNLETTFRFMMTGRHGFAGRESELPPDPYGRWIAAANYLTAIPEHADARDVSEALRRLAAHAGDTGAPSWDPVYDPMIRELRSRVDPTRQELFDQFAPTSGATSSASRAPELAEALAAAARRTDPAIDPIEGLAAVDRPVHVLHGRRDHLIPYTESLRLRDALSASRKKRVTITPLFGHSAQDPFPFGSAAWEVPRFVGALRAMLGMI